MPVTELTQRDQVPAISRSLLVLFRYIVRRYFRRHFHSVRLSGVHHLDSLQGPLIIYANHGSWWDPMIAYLLAAKLFPHHKHFAPMDADALKLYPVLRKLGIFPVEMRTPRGAARFLRTGQAILRSGAILWVTPQGQFADTRQRPLVFKPGLAALAARMGHCTILPLAIEYAFWDERLPEALLQFGQPIHLAPDTPTDTAEALDRRLVVALETTMDELKARVLTRSPSAFERTLSFHAAGTGGIYGLAQRLRAIVLRKPYHPEHTPSQKSEPISR